MRPTRWRAPDGVSVLLLAAVLAPFGVEWVRLQFFGPTDVHLRGDIAVADYNARLAMHGHMVVGTYDRFGWHHPGPALYYLYAAFYWVFGATPRTLFATALLLALASTAAAVVVVHRRVGVAAGRLCTVAAGLFLIFLASSASAPGTLDILSILTSPWNPDVVIAPTLLFMVLAASAVDRGPSMVAMLVVGSCLVQADVGTTPLVAVVALATVLAALVRWRRRRRAANRPPPAPPARYGRHARLPESRRATPSAAPDDPQATRRRSPATTALTVGVGAALLALVWFLPVYQQVQSTDGNLAAIAHFFTTHRNPLNHYGLLTPFSYLAKAFGGLGQARTDVPAVPLAASYLVAAVSAVVLVATLVLSPRRPPYLRRLGGLVVLGLVVAMFAGNDIIGVPFGYLMEWSLGVFTAGVFAVAALVAVRLARWAGAGPAGSRRRGLAAASVVVTLAVTAVLAVQVARYPSLASASDPSVGRVTQQVRSALRHPDLPTLVVGRLNTPDALWVYDGLINELQRDGVDVVVQPAWFNTFGNGTFGLHHMLAPGPHRTETVVTVTEPRRSAAAAAARAFPPMTTSVRVER